MVRVEKEYVFDGPDGKTSLAGCSGTPDSCSFSTSCSAGTGTRPCPSCTEFTTELTGALVERLRSRDTAFAMVCRAPLEKIEAWTAGRGWAVPWYSSHGSDFKYDFQVTLDGAAGQVTYNYRPEPDAVDGERSVELPGASCFVRDGGEVFHTYSAYARGLDHVDTAYAFLDQTAFGRQEAWEEPKGRAPVIHGTL